MSVYGFGDLSWVDPIVQASLAESMSSGEFDDGAIDPDVLYMRHLAPGTTLNVTVDEVRDEEEPSDGGTPWWAWLLIALGVFGLLVAGLYFMIQRRKQQEEFERQKAETEFLSGGNDGGNDGGNEETKESEKDPVPTNTPP